MLTPEEIDELKSVTAIRPGDVITVYVQKGYRDAVILGVHSEKALLEYELPSGCTALWEVHTGNPYIRVRTLNYYHLPDYWKQYIVQHKTRWIGHPRQAKFGRKGWSTVKEPWR
jgi:hypothetical protein